MPEDKPVLSLVVPAYQEQDRITPTLQAVVDYLSLQFPGSEVIVVCDGCTDNTASIARQFSGRKECALSVIELPENRGKGAAVKAGVMSASGLFIFFTDADLSYSPDLIADFLSKLEAGADIVIAQRNKETQVVEWQRQLLAKLSRALIGNIVTPGIRDTQAGFKAFRADVAKRLYSLQRIERFLFDVEMLMLALKCRYKIEKVYVGWEDKPGSSVRVVRDALRALVDLFKIYWLMLSGHYGRALRRLDGTAERKI